MRINPSKIFSFLTGLPSELALSTKITVQFGELSEKKIEFAPSTKIIDQLGEISEKNFFEKKKIAPLIFLDLAPDCNR
eukprot:g77879.t1